MRPEDEGPFPDLLEKIKRYPGTLFTCFTGTKAQILTLFVHLQRRYAAAIRRGAIVPAARAFFFYSFFL